MLIFCDSCREIIEIENREPNSDTSPDIGTTQVLNGDIHRCVSQLRGQQPRLLVT